MSEKVDRLEAHAEAETEFAGELRGDALEARWKALESSSASSDDRLRALKARVQGEGRLLGSGSEGKALPESGKSQVPTDGSPDKA